MNWEPLKDGHSPPGRRWQWFRFPDQKIMLRACVHTPILIGGRMVVPCAINREANTFAVEVS